MSLNKRRLLKTFGAIFITGLGILSWLSLELLPSPKNAESPATSFSALRALEHVKKLTQSPRRLGSTAHEVTRDYLLKELSTLGCELSLQKTFSATAFRLGIFAGPVENILCLFRGKKEDSVLLMSHYDSVHMSPGAGDAASGVAIILETARALKERSKENSLLLLFTDGEESGLLGAAAFVKSQLEKKYKVRTLLNFEARGNAGPLALFETLHFNEVNSTAIKSMPRPIGNSFMDFLYQFLPNETDLSIFKPLDLPALNFAFARGLEHYHKSSDTVENLSLSSLQHAGESALYSTDSLLNSKLEISHSKLLYQDIFGRYHISYPPILIKIFAVLLIFLLFWRLYKERHPILKTLLCFFGTLVFFISSLFLTFQSHQYMTRIWGSTAIIIDFYLFFAAYTLVLLSLVHLAFLKVKYKFPELRSALLLCLCVLLIFSFLSTELGTLIVWSSLGVVLFSGISVIWKFIASIPLAIFLPQFLHSALIADSGTQFVLPVFVLIFSALLIHLLNNENPSPTKLQQIKGLHFAAIGLGIGLFVYLGQKHLGSLSSQKRADYFEILSEDRLYVAISKSRAIPTLFPQKLDPLKKEFLLSNLDRWRIHPASLNIFESHSELKREIQAKYSIKELENKSTQYFLTIPTQDYECVHILFDPEAPILDLKVNGQSPYTVTAKKFAPKGPHSPDFVESCSLRKVPLQLEFKTAVGQNPIRELLAVFTQNTQAPAELKLHPSNTIMSHFSNTLYVLKKIAL